MSDGISSLSERFQVLELLGRGGYAEVYKALRKEDNLVVALKLPRISGSQTTQFEDFLKEAEKWRKLEHPHIVKLLEYGKTPVPYMAMEYMPGGSLRGKIGSLNIHETLTIASQVSDALFHAHRHGLAHLDIKPENILFDAQGNARLSDWGLSKMMLDSSGMTVAGLGTPYYEAPEQIVPGSKYGKRDWQTDIWQFGVTLYEMVTGKVPFPAQNMLELTHKIFSEEPLPLNKASPYLSIPPELDSLIMKCLQKDKKERFADFYPVKEQIQAILNPSEVPEVRKPPSKIEKPAPVKKAERKPSKGLSGILVASLIATIIIGFSGLVFWMSQSDKSKGSPEKGTPVVVPVVPIFITPTPMPTPTPAFKAIPTPTPTPAPTPTPTYSLIIYSEPDGAEIYIDNEHRGIAPLAIYVLHGTYILKLTMAGYRDYIGTVEIKENTTVRYPLTRQTGIIEVTSNPSGASFTLRGPANYSGTTPWSRTDAPVGPYTIEWGRKDNHKSPSPERKTLSSDIAISFHGPYVLQTGTIEVTSNPSGASFTLRGPANYSGTTPWSRTDAPVGPYIIEWGRKDDHTSPSPERKTLSSDIAISFHGPYVLQTGIIRVASTPSGAFFNLRGPVSYSDTTPWGGTNAPAGDYTVSWRPISGYLTPIPETKTVTPGETIFFHGAYIPLPPTPAPTPVPTPIPTPAPAPSTPTPTPSNPDEPTRGINSGQTLSGVIAIAYDVDLFTFTGSSGQVAEIRLRAATGSNLDTFLELIAPNGQKIAENDDSENSRNSLIRQSLTRGGTYIIRAKGFGNSKGAYNLSLSISSITPTPAPTPVPTPIPTPAPAPTPTPAPTQLPDLVPSIVKAQRVSPSTILLTFVIQNQGTGQAPGGYPVLISVNSSTYGSVTGVPLQPGQPQVYNSIPLNLTFRGRIYSLQIIVDPTNMVQEINEGNNITPPYPVE